MLVITLLTPSEMFTQSEIFVRLAVTAQQDLNFLYRVPQGITIRANKSLLKAIAYHALLAVIVMARLILPELTSLALQRRHYLRLL